MVLNRARSLCGVMLLTCISGALSQFVPQVQIAAYPLADQTQAASLSNAPVGFYTRRGLFGDRQESAASLSGAPVGLFSRQNSQPQFVGFPTIYSSPFLYPPVYPVPGFAPPPRPRPPSRFPPARPSGVSPARPPRPQVLSPARPVKSSVIPSPPKKPGLNPRSGIFSSLPGVG